MFKTQAELINSVITKIKQNKLVYRPEQLTALYYITYFQNKTSLELQKLAQNLQKHAAIIKQAQIAPKLTIAFSKQKIDHTKALDLQIKQMTNVPEDANLLLDNQLLAEIKAPYRTVLLNATIDLAENYEALIVPKNKYETSLINLFKHVTQGILLINVQDGTVLGVIPCATFLTYPEPAHKKKKPAFYNLAKKTHYDNYLNVTVKELAKLIQPVKLIKINNVPLFHLHLAQTNYATASKDEKYNCQIGFMAENDDESGKSDTNDALDLDLIKKVLTAPEKIPAKNWANKIKQAGIIDYTSIELDNLQKYLLNELMWHIDQQGRFSLFTIDHLSYWDKMLVQYQTNDIEHIHDTLTKRNHDLRKDPDSVDSLLLANVVSDFLQQKYQADHEKYLKEPFYQIFSFPKKRKLKAQKIALKQPKKQVNWHLKPLMPAQGINQVLQEIANDQGQAFYEQGHLINVDTEYRYNKTINDLTDKVIVRKIKL